MASSLAVCAAAASGMGKTPPISRCKEHAAGDNRRRRRARSEPEEEEEEEEEQPVNPCDEFNTLKWRMSYASRK